MGGDTETPVTRKADSGAKWLRLKIAPMLTNNVAMGKFFIFCAFVFLACIGRIISYQIVVGMEWVIQINHTDSIWPIGRAP